KELGLGLKAVVKTTVFLVGPADFGAMNEAYREFFPAAPPARSTARLGAELPGLKLSIEAIAVYEPRAEEGAGTLGPDTRPDRAGRCSPAASPGRRCRPVPRRRSTDSSTSAQTPRRSADQRPFVPIMR